jgi:hypothetical protein
MIRSMPVMKELSLDARKRAPAAISAGWPMHHLGQHLPHRHSGLFGAAGGALKHRGFCRPGAEGVHANAAVLQLCCPGARKRSHSNLGARIHGIAALELGNGRDDHDRAARGDEWECLLHREEGAASVDVEQLVVVFSSDLSCPRSLKLALATTTSSLPCLLRMCSQRRSRSELLVMSPCTAVAPFPSSAFALSSSGWRRPVMYTCRARRTAWRCQGQCPSCRQ